MVLEQIKDLLIYSKCNEKAIQSFKQGSGCEAIYILKLSLTACKKSSQLGVQVTLRSGETNQETGTIVEPIEDGGFYQKGGDGKMCREEIFCRQNKKCLVIDQIFEAGEKGLEKTISVFLIWAVKESAAVDMGNTESANSREKINNSGQDMYKCELPMRLFNRNVKWACRCTCWSLKQQSGLEFSLGATIMELTYKSMVKRKGT